MKALAKVLDKDFSANRIDAAYITTKDKTFTRVQKSKIDKIAKEIKKK
jgi:20S proteasome alpha/beta subunit